MESWPLTPVALRRAGAFALLLAISTLAAIAFFSDREWRDFAQSRREGQLSNLILTLNERVLGLVKDAETGQRGYLLTGSAEYLEPYRQAIERLPASLSDLRNAVSTRPVQRVRVAQLEALIAAKLAELDQSVKLRDTHGSAAAVQLVTENRGQRLMDDIRNVSAAIGADGEARLANSKTSISLHSEEARFVTIFGVGLLAVLVIGAFAANDRSAKQQEKLIGDLAEANRRSGEVMELLRTTFYSIGDGVITTDTNGSVQLMNSMAEKITGWGETEARGRPVEEVFATHAEVQTAQVSPLRAALTEEAAPPSAQTRLVSKSGAEFLVESSAAPIHGQDGALRGGVLVFRDVTELRHNEERLRHVAKLESLGVLAGGIAHDFNNLLVGIVGTSSLLEDYFPPAAPGRELLETLQRASSRAAELTNQMLAYSGRGRFVVRAVDISREVEEIVALVKASIGKNVTLKLTLARNLPKVEADAAQLQQLIMNLVVNAAEAVGEAPGSVSVSTSIRTVSVADAPVNVLGEGVAVGRYVTLSVVDTGHGMDTKTRARIFDPFFTTKFTGRGLGLAATLGIVKGHHGAIEVDSAPGKGATFRVYLPVAKEMNAS